MNFTDLDKDLAQEFNISKSEAKKILSYIQKRIYYYLTFGTDFSIHRIGTFKRVISKAKPYLHLKTGKMEMSKTKYKLKFFVRRTFDDYLKTKKPYVVQK